MLWPKHGDIGQNWCSIPPGTACNATYHAHQGQLRGGEEVLTCFTGHVVRAGALCFNSYSVLAEHIHDYSVLAY